MAGCKSSLTGEDFYGPYDAQDTAKANAKELGVEPVPSLNITYTEVCCYAYPFLPLQSPVKPALCRRYLVCTHHFVHVCDQRSHCWDSLRSLVLQKQDSLVAPVS